MTRTFIFILSVLMTGCMSTAPSLAGPYINAASSQEVSRWLDAEPLLGADFMQGPNHKVAPEAALVGNLLRYTIETPDEQMVVTGTEQTKTRIREIYATEALRQRSTAGTILGAAKDRTTNLVETPYRFGKTLVHRAGDISNVEDAIFFVPEQVGLAVGGLLGGVGELFVTGVRITSGAAGTKCSGLQCVEKLGSDVWSGLNSLAGKHNASRRLHAEFGTDPETTNKSYRRQVNRLAYANAYPSTAIKLGAGQAGIDYISPAFTAVGFYNNAEFVGQYEDAHRQKNHEKRILRSWGADPRVVDSFYGNRAFTKRYRRRLFRALDVIPDKVFALRLLYDAANVAERHDAETVLVTNEYIASQASNGTVARYIADAQMPLIVSNDGTTIWPIYADYLAWTPSLQSDLQSLSEYGGPGAIHVLGYADETVKRQASQWGATVLERSEVGR